VRPRRVDYVVVGDRREQVAWWCEAGEGRLCSGVRLERAGSLVV